MPACVICRAPTTILLLELRGALCGPCLELVRATDAELRRRAGAPGQRRSWVPAGDPAKEPTK